MIRLGGAVLVAAMAAGSLLTGHPRPARRGTTQGDVEAAIRAVQTELRRAAERLDAPALYAHVVDGDTPPIIENGRLAQTWDAARARTAQGFQSLASVRYAYTSERITVLSATAALWIAEGTASATLADGRRIEALFAQSIVFVLRDGRWQVLHAHRSAPNRP
jgi:ketosteroid isomerase-like protein